jgi:hypothetical protein
VNLGEHIQAVKKLLKVMDCYSISFECVMKRMTDETGDRDFHERFIWRAAKLSNNSKRSSRWKGFATSEECLKDAIKKLS